VEHHGVPVDGEVSWARILCGSGIDDRHRPLGNRDDE
jgi:hypothetical protein